MWDFNWGMFWALVAYGALKFGVKWVLGLYGARVNQTRHKPLYRELLRGKYRAARGSSLSEAVGD
jgi:hypothetical protein